MAKGLRFGVLGSWPGCMAALLPIENLLGGMSWDTSRSLPIFQVGAQINHYCVETMGLQVGGTGGVDRVGESLVSFAVRVRSHTESLSR